MRKHLGYGPEEWDRLPWWQQRMFMEELSDDNQRASGEEPKPRPVYQPKPTPAEAAKTQAEISARERAQGFTVIG